MQSQNIKFYLILNVVLVLYSSHFPFSSHPILFSSSFTLTNFSLFSSLGSPKSFFPLSVFQHACVHQCTWIHSLHPNTVCRCFLRPCTLDPVFCTEVCDLYLSLRSVVGLMCRLLIVRYSSFWDVLQGSLIQNLFEICHWILSWFIIVLDCVLRCPGFCLLTF